MVVDPANGDVAQVYCPQYHPVACLGATVLTRARYNRLGNVVKNSHCHAHSQAATQHRGTPSLDLHDYFRIIRRNWVLVVALALVGVLAGGVASILISPTYTAKTQLFVAIQNSGSVLELQQGNSFSQARVQSYVKTVQSPIVLQPAIDELGLATSAEELASRVAATNDLNTVLIDITVSDRSPVQAAALAQAIADSLIKAVDALEKPKTGGASPISLSVITPAKASGAPSAPNSRLNVLLGLTAGMMLGLAAAVMRSKFDNRIRGEADLRVVTDAPLLGGLTLSADAQKRPLLTQAKPQSPRAESFRQLRTNLQFANVARRSKSVLITSSLPGEGKSTTATNLAISLAEAGQRVCLVDADLRRPMINEYLGLERNVGLTTAMVEQIDVMELLQPWGEGGLFVLTSGRIPPNPSELLGSSQVAHIIHRLEEAFDIVIIDTPPVLPVTDAAVLSQHVGGVIVVVGVLSAKRNDLQRSLAGLGLVEADILGVVLNRLPSKGADAYSYSYGGYESSANEMVIRPGQAALSSEFDVRQPGTYPGLEPSFDAKDSDGFYAAVSESTSGVPSQQRPRRKV